MRLCIVTFKECWPDENGGWLSYGGFPQQMQAISSLFDDVRMVVVGVPPRPGGMPLPAGALVVPLARPAGSNGRRKLSVLARLPYYLGRMLPHVSRADVVHLPLPGDLPLLGLALGVLCRKRMLVRYGGSWFPTTQSTFMNRITKMCMRGLGGPRHVMFATGAGELPPAPGIEWLFATAISEAEVRTVQPDLDRIPSDLRLIYPGRLSSEKGVRYLIEALALLRASREPWARRVTLTVAGDGPERDALEALADRLGCRSGVRFAGQLPRPHLLAELLASDVCVLPSLTESFCKARLDAMLCGVPTITTPVGFGAELVGGSGERGWLVPCADPGAIAAVVGRLAVDGAKWPALRRRCRRFAEQFTVERWRAQIAEACAARWAVRVEEGRLR
jgi:hypothetical protein